MGLFVWFWFSLVSSLLRNIYSLNLCLAQRAFRKRLDTEWAIMVMPSMWGWEKLADKNQHFTVPHRRVSGEALPRLLKPFLKERVQILCLFCLPPFASSWPKCGCNVCRSSPSFRLQNKNLILQMTERSDRQEHVHWSLCGAGLPYGLWGLIVCVDLTEPWGVQVSGQTLFRVFL